MKIALKCPLNGINCFLLKGLDIGPESVTHFTSVISKANTIVWNGCVYIDEHSICLCVCVFMCACCCHVYECVLKCIPIMPVWSYTAPQECLNGTVLPMDQKHSWMQWYWQQREELSLSLVKYLSLKWYGMECVQSVLFGRWRRYCYMCTEIWCF